MYVMEAVWDDGAFPTCGVFPAPEWSLMWD